jgi:hypothetical protein
MAAAHANSDVLAWPGNNDHARDATVQPGTPAGAEELLKLCPPSAVPPRFAVRMGRL